MEENIFCKDGIITRTLNFLVSDHQNQMFHNERSFNHVYHVTTMKRGHVVGMMNGVMTI